MGAFEYTVRHLLGASYTGGGLAFTSGGTSLAVALHGRVNVVDLAAGRSRTLPFEAGRTLKSLSTAVVGVAGDAPVTARQTATNRFLLAVDEADRATLLSFPGGRVVARVTLRVPGGVVSSSLSPCGRFAAFAGTSSVQIWSVPDGGVPEYAAFDKLLQMNAGGAGGKGSMCWSPDSRRLAVGGRDGVVYLYTVRRREGARGRVKPAVLYGHRDAVARVAFVGTRGLLTVSRDGALFCWRLRYADDSCLDGDVAVRTNVHGDDDQGRNEDDMESSDDADAPEGDAGVDNARIVPVEARLSSRHFVKSGGGKRVRSVAVHSATGLLTVGMSNGVFTLFELPDVMSAREDAEYDAGLFELADRAKLLRKELMRKDRKLKRKEAKKRRRRNGSSPRGDARIRSDDEENVETGNAEEGVENVSAATLENTNEDADDGGEAPPRIGFTDLTIVHTLSASAGAITDLEFSPTGEWLALASSHSGQITVWEWRSETHILKQQAHLLSASTLAFSPDGRAVATGSRDGRVKLWNVSNGFCAATFSDHASAVTSIAFAANDVIVSASLDGTVRAYDIRRYRNFRILVGPPPHRQFGAVAVDAAGEIVAAGCVDTFEVVAWSLRTGQVVELLAGHKGPVSSISFRPKRGTLATASWDGTVRMWDMYERKGSCEVLEHSKEALAVCFRPDGKELAVASMSGEIVLWDADRAIISGTIDGARDAAAGRTRDSRIVARQKGHFQTLSYSADGHFLLAGAASKYVCVYNVKDGTAPSLVDRYVVTDNKNFDGLLDQLNSGELTAGGYAQEVIDDDDEGDERYGEAKIAAGRSLPGAESELKTQRKKMMKAEVKCVQFCPTGRVWGAVTTEGVMIYGEASAAEGDGDAVAFDPTDLAMDVTPEIALAAAKKGNYETGLLVALRLNERHVLSKVLESVPYADVALIVSRLPVAYFTRLVLLVAWRLDHGPHISFDLEWARRLLSSQGPRAHTVSPDPAYVNTALRALHRSVSVHSKRLAPLAARNTDSLAYLVTLSGLAGQTEMEV
jgi:WD40 repeat protein